MGRADLGPSRGFDGSPPISRDSQAESRLRGGNESLRVSDHRPEWVADLPSSKIRKNRENLGAPCGTIEWKQETGGGSNQ
jgi:hypothetical protein